MKPRIRLSVTKTSGVATMLRTTTVQNKSSLLCDKSTSKSPSDDENGLTRALIQLFCNALDPRRN
jgi:hypothetical protein